MHEILDKLQELAEGSSERARGGDLGAGPKEFVDKHQLDADELDEMARMLERQVDPVVSAGVEQRVVIQALCQSAFQVGYEVAMSRQEVKS